MATSIDVSRFEIVRELGRLGAFFAETRPDPAMLEEYVSMALESNWRLEGLTAAVTDCIRNLRFYPKPVELRMAYDLWAMEHATLERLGVGPQFASLPSGLLESDGPTGSERGDILRGILRDHLREWSSRSLSEQAAYVSERAEIRRACEERGEQYLTQVEEKMRAAGVWEPESATRERLARKRLGRLYSCLRCLDAGWMRDLKAAVGSAARAVKCRCGGVR